MSLRCEDSAAIQPDTIDVGSNQSDGSVFELALSVGKIP